jgi:hypothetical protein
MPRKISEITDGKIISIRLSEAQRQMFYDIGGHDWLRKYLNRQLLSEKIYSKDVQRPKPTTPS